MSVASSVLITGRLAGIIRPVLDRTLPFRAANEALAYVDAGRARGKVAVNLKPAAVGS